MNELKNEREIILDSAWTFDHGSRDFFQMGPSETEKTVNLPHDYMIEGEVFKEAVSGAASGYYHATTAHYKKRGMGKQPGDYIGEAGPICDILLQGIFMLKCRKELGLLLPTIPIFVFFYLTRMLFCFYAVVNPDKQYLCAVILKSICIISGFDLLQSSSSRSIPF